VLAQKYGAMRWGLWKLYGGSCAAAAVFVLGAGFFFSRRLTGSLRQLAKAADLIARGKPAKKAAEPAHDDEILDLTRTFNTMAESLRDREEKKIRGKDDNSMEFRHLDKPRKFTDSSKKEMTLALEKGKAKLVNTWVSFPCILVTIQPIRSSFPTTLLYNL